MSELRCPLCGRELVEPSVRLAAGGRAHLGCAEQQAAAAWRWRRGLALTHLALIGTTLLVLAAVAGPSPALLVIGAAWATLHMRTHRRFWHYVTRDLRRWLRRR